MKLRQNSFHGGALSPELARRMDLEKYGSGLAAILNFIPKATGSVVNRTGSKFMEYAKYANTRAVTLMPFKFSNTQSYQLEVGHEYVRFYKDGARIIYPSTVASLLFATQANPCKVFSGPQHVQDGDLIRISGVGGMVALNGNDYTVQNEAELELEIIAITKANPAVVTVKSHTGLANGDRIWISDVVGMTQVNDLGFTVAGMVTKSVSSTAVTRGASVTTIACAGHTFVVGETVWISGLKGCYELNNRAVLVTAIVPGVSISFALDSENFTDYISGGTLRCHSFQLSGVNSTIYSTYSHSGLATRRTFELAGIDSTAFGAFTNAGSYAYAPSWLGQPVEISSPYQEDDLALLGYTQSADILSIFRTGYERRDLVRRDHHLWRLSIPKYGPAINPPLTVTVTDPSGGVGSRDFYYQVTAVDKDTGEESLPRGNVVTNRDNNANPLVQWPAVANALKYNIYKRVGKSGTAGAYGFVATTEELSWQDVTDDGGRFTPGSLGPPLYQSPDDTLGNPQAGSYFKQRFAIANFDRGPQSLKLSQIARFKNFNTSSPVRDDDGISSLFASLESQTIHHLVGGIDDLVVLTSGGEWVVRGNESGLVSPSTIQTFQYSNWGTTTVRPVVVGGVVVFVQARGKSLRDFAFKLDSNKYDGNNLAIFVPHYFKSATIVSLAYAQVPDSVIYAVLSDGSMLTLTYMRDEKIWAWAQHTTTGFYEWVSTNPEGAEDAVYVVVKRFLNGAYTRTIERFASRQILNVKDGFFVDCGLSLDVPVAIESISWAAPIQFTITAHGFSNGDLVDVEGLVGETNLNGNRYVVQNALPNTFELAATDGSAWGDEHVVGTGVVRKAVTHITGAQHLAGKMVAVCADGVSRGPILVDGAGEFDIPQPASRVHAGLGYLSRVVTLEPDLSRLRLSGGGELVNVSEVKIFSVDSEGGIFAGANHPSATMLPVQWQATDDYPDLRSAVEFNIPVEPVWHTGSVVIEQRSPLPVELLAVETRFEVSDA